MVAQDPPAAGVLATRPPTLAADKAGSMAWYALGVLCFANILNFLDRSIVGLVAEPIKVSLGLTDSQLGFINGAGFVVFYVAVGFPIARLADRGVRRRLLAIGVGFWSLCTLLTGMVQNFFQLVAARAGLAVGEATVLPVGMSMIGDLFPPGQRMRATAIFQSSPLIGIMFGMPLVGWVVTHYGWRPTLVVLGLPGLLLAAVIWLTVREPVRGLYDRPELAAARDDNIWQALAALARNPAFVILTLGTAINAIGGMAQTAFIPAYLQRTLGMNHLEIGTVMGPAVGGAAALGGVAGGFLADWLRKRSGGFHQVVLVLALIHIASVGGTYLFHVADSKGMLVLGGALQSFFNMLKTGPFLAIALAVVSPRMRGFATTVIAVVASSVIGAVLGPAIAGGLSDALAPSLGVYSLRWALVCTSCGAFLLAGATYLFSLPYIRKYDREQAALPA